MPWTRPSSAAAIRRPRPTGSGREKIREFAEAIGATDPAYHDPEAARALGPRRRGRAADLPDRGDHGRQRAVIADPELGLDYCRVVHGDQRFVYTRPVVAGEELVCACTVEEITGRGRQRLPDHRAPRSPTPTGEPVGRPSGRSSSYAGSELTIGSCRSATTLPGHPGRPGPVRRRVRRLQPDPLERPGRQRGRAARRDRPRHVHHGAGRPGGDRLGRRPGAVRRVRRAVHPSGLVPDDDEGTEIEVPGRGQGGRPRTG